MNINILVTFSPDFNEETNNKQNALGSRSPTSFRSASRRSDAPRPPGRRVPGTTLLPALRSPDSRPSRVFSTESVQQQSCHKPRRPVLSANGRAGGTPRHTSSGGRGSLGPNGEAEGQTRQQQRAGGKDGWGTGRSRVRTKQ